MNRDPNYWQRIINELNDRWVLAFDHDRERELDDAITLATYIHTKLETRA